MCYNIPNISILPGEIFIQVTDCAVSGVYNCYRVSNYGRVFNCITNTFNSVYSAYNNYLSVSLATIDGYKNVLIHRLMMLCFYPISNPELFVVNHKDGNKLHNVLNNLEWCTSKENTLHAYDTGLCNLGEDNCHTTITNDTAKAICEELQNGDLTNKQIALLYNTTEAVISDIKQGHGWRFISKNYNFYQRPGRLLTDETVEKICEYFQNNSRNSTIKNHCSDALRYIGMEPTERLIDTVRKIFTRKYYISISNKYLF